MQKSAERAEGIPGPVNEARQTMPGLKNTLTGCAVQAIKMSVA